MKLLIDPDLLLPDAVRRPEALIARHGATVTVFGYYSADEATGPRCPRCNRLLHVHTWQFVDPDIVEEGGVIECATTA